MLGEGKDQQALHRAYVEKRHELSTKMRQEYKCETLLNENGAIWQMGLQNKIQIPFRST